MSTAVAVPDFEALAQPGIRRLRAYDPGHDLIALRRRFASRMLAELGSNESVHGCSPAALAAIQAALPLLHRYPDPLGGDLKQALARRHGLAIERLVLGNGSHELLVLLAQVFAGPGSSVVMARHGFAVYALAAQAVGAELRVAAPLPRDAHMPLGHDLDAIAALVGEGTRLVYLANPNNPTGTWFPRTALERLFSALPAEVLVVVDEAYAEFVDEGEPASALALCARHPNLVVTRTFSKAYGLAGLRIGYAVAHPDVAALLERLRESFNVNALALAAAEAALADQDHVACVRRDTAAERAWLAGELAARGAFVFPSRTNFLLAEFRGDVAALERQLLARGVVPRPMAGYGLPQCLRITVGTRAENAALLAGLDAA